MGGTLMVPSAVHLARHYRELRLPIDIFAGASDKIVGVGVHSGRLHREVPHSRLISSKEMSNTIADTSLKSTLH